MGIHVVLMFVFVLFGIMGSPYVCSIFCFETLVYVFVFVLLIGFCESWKQLGRYATFLLLTRGPPLWAPNIHT